MAVVDRIHSQSNKSANNKVTGDLKFTDHRNTYMGVSPLRGLKKVNI